MKKKSSKRKFLGWPAAIIILLLIIVTEALPFLPGIGNQGSLNSGNLYIILHFTIIPLICLLHLFWNTFGEIASAKKANAQASGASISSTIIPALYILILAFYQQPFLKPLLG